MDKTKNVQRVLQKVETKEGTNLEEDNRAEDTTLAETVVALEALQSIR